MDRVRRCVGLVHLPHGHASQALTDALKALVEHLPQSARRTMIWDLGSEMARRDLAAAWFD